MMIVVATGPSGSGVRLSVVPPSQAAAASSPNRRDVSPYVAIRAVPLLAVFEIGSDRLIAVGQTRVSVGAKDVPVVTVIVRALWLASAYELGDRNADGATGDPVTGWQAIPDDARLPVLLQSLVERVSGEPTDGAESLATTIAKDLAERSRNAVGALRGFRYGLERLLADSLRGGGTRKLELVLADIIELSTAGSRARDEAREAAREGLWTWLTDDATYHAHRRALDPSLPRRKGERRGRRRRWFRTLDAGVRQCQQMDRMISEEASLLHSLLNSASTIAVTRDARAQETFNLVATVGGVLLGLPALIIALYGATAVLPLRVSNYIVLAPLVVAGVLAAVLAAYLPGREREGKAKRFGLAILAVITTLALLATAGALVTPLT